MCGIRVFMHFKKQASHWVQKRQRKCTISTTDPKPCRLPVLRHTKYDRFPTGFGDCGVGQITVYTFGTCLYVRAVNKQLNTNKYVNGWIFKNADKNWSHDLWPERLLESMARTMRAWKCGNGGYACMGVQNAHDSVTQFASLDEAMRTPLV